MWKFIWFILVVLSIAILGAVVVGFYYNLARFRKEVEDSWSYIDYELENRIILVDNLVETVKRDVGHGNSILKEVAEVQSWLEYAETVKETGEANNKLTMVLEDLFVLLEGYPDLTTSKRFERLAEQLEENEYLIAEYGYLYNEMAYVYNSKLQSFPHNAVANYFGFEDAEYFEPGGDASDVRDLDFDSGKEGE